RMRRASSDSRPAGKRRSYSSRTRKVPLASFAPRSSASARRTYAVSSLALVAALAAGAGGATARGGGATARGGGAGGGAAGGASSAGGGGALALSATRAR